MAITWPKCWLPCTYHLSSTPDMWQPCFQSPVIGKLEVTLQLPERGRKTNEGRAGPQLLSLWSFITAELPSEYLSGCSRSAAVQQGSVRLPLMNINMQAWEKPLLSRAHKDLLNYPRLTSAKCCTHWGRKPFVTGFIPIIYSGVCFVFKERKLNEFNKYVSDLLQDKLIGFVQWFSCFYIIVPI